MNVPILTKLRNLLRRVFRRKPPPRRVLERGQRLNDVQVWVDGKPVDAHEVYEFDGLRRHIIPGTVEIDPPASGDIIVRYEVSDD